MSKSRKPKVSIIFKSVAGIVLLLAVFSLIVGIIGYNSFTEALLSQYADGAFRTAETAAMELDADKMEEYARSGGVTEEYQTVLDSMERLCNSSGATFIYVIRPDLTDYGHITFLFSTINENSDYTRYEFGYVRETTNDEYREKYRMLYEGKSERELVIRDKGYIETDAHITAMIPLKNGGKTTAILCVQRQMDIMVNVRNSYINKVLFLMIGLVIFVIVGQTKMEEGILTHAVAVAAAAGSDAAGVARVENAYEEPTVAAASPAPVDMEEVVAIESVEHKGMTTAGREACKAHGIALGYVRVNHIKPIVNKVVTAKLPMRAVVITEDFDENIGIEVGTGRRSPAHLDSLTAHEHQVGNCGIVYIGLTFTLPVIGVAHVVPIDDGVAWNSLCGDCGSFHFVAVSSVLVGVRVAVGRNNGFCLFWVLVEVQNLCHCRCRTPCGRIVPCAVLFLVVLVTEDVVRASLVPTCGQ